MNSTRTFKLFNAEQLQWAVVLFSCCIFIGLVCSRALASIGMIAIIVAALISNNPAETFKAYFKSKELYILAVYFLIVLATGIYSENKSDWLNWVRIKIPYLFLPLAFAPLKKLDARKLTVILYGYILTFFISASIILIRYALDYENQTHAFSMGSSLNIKYSHIRYTLMLAFSFFCAVYMVEKKLFLFSKHEKWIQLLFIAFSFIALHIITVRSGLVALYIGLLFLAFRWVIIEQRFITGLIIIVLLSAAPFVAYKTAGSFRNKINYMRYDLQKYKQGEINDYSDAMRLVSMKIGYQIWLEHEAFGVGSGDLEDETNKIYAKQYPTITPENRRIPHNQFLWVLASTGTVGLVLFLTAFFVPLLSRGYWRQWPIVVLHLILFSSFFTEDTFEEQIGTGFYLIFLLILMNHFKHE